MAEPFQTRAGRGVNRLPGLAGGSRKRAFLAELENELARAERVTQVDPSRVTELAKERASTSTRTARPPDAGCIGGFSSIASTTTR